MSIVDEVLEPLHALAGRIEEVVKLQETTLEAARKLCNESGIHNARQSLERSVITIGKHQEALRQAQEVERVTKERLVTAVDEAEWELGTRFVVESNRTYLLVPDAKEGEETRRQITADEKRAWVTREARKQAAVQEAEAATRQAEIEVAKARDAITIADKQFSASKMQVTASVEILHTLALSLPSTGHD